MAEKISTPPAVDILDWAATGAAIGVIGVNSNWWGGTAKSWTRVKAVMIGATIGTVAGLSAQTK